MKPALLMIATLLAGPALAETHEVAMYTRNDRGPMIYEPDFLRIQPGDSVRFVPVQRSHNAATIDGMIPAGAQPFKGNINEDFTVTLTEPGIYGVKCSPHYMMGMVMLIAVGDAGNPVFPDDLPPRARQRFDQIMAAQQ
ncbi:pseudoazurin [Chachezhania sediminis]|uniref:pseudoazurin n=1 Tax=Chachezhania sediminis TaxID=2599291 RepID=UPI00131B3023|nr:pseudoazurin [Chachezhania sediminis]